MFGEAVIKAEDLGQGADAIDAAGGTASSKGKAIMACSFNVAWEAEDWR